MSVQPAPPYGLRSLGSPQLAALLRRQRRAQADAIVRRVARSQAARSVGEVRRLLTTALRGVGVRPTAASLDRLAASTSAGRTAALREDWRRS